MKEEKQKTTNEDKLVEHYSTKIRMFLASLRASPSLAEDLAQETLIIVICRLRAGTILQLDRLDGFVFGTARNLYFGHLRKKSSSLMANQDLDQELESSTVCHDDQLSALQVRDQLKNWIGRLKMERDREVLLRSFLYDQPKVQVCNELELTAKKFDVVMNRAKIRLRASVREYEYAAHF